MSAAGSWTHVNSGMSMKEVVSQKYVSTANADLGEQFPCGILNGGKIQVQSGLTNAFNG